MLTLILGPDWTANRSEIFRRLTDDVKNHRANRILMVPELISHDTERRLASQAGDTASRYVQVLPFTRLARRMTDMVGGAPECMDRGSRTSAGGATRTELTPAVSLLWGKCRVEMFFLTFIRVFPPLWGYPFSFFSLQVYLSYRYCTG